MSIDYINLNNKISSLVPDASDNRKVVAAAVALLVAEAAPVPTAPVEAVENYYSMNVESLTYGKMGELNEKLNFDVAVCKELVRIHWLLRYNTLFPISSAKRKQDSQYGYFDTVMGVGMFVDEQTHQFVNQYKNEILAIYVDLEYLLKD